MSDFFESLSQQLKERLASPLSGAFIVSWLIINYRFMVVLLSDSAPLEKFDIIHSQIFPDLWAIGYYGIGVPLLLSSAYIIAYPYPARWAMSYSLYQKRKSREARIKSEGLIAMTREDVDAVVDPLTQKITKLQDELEKKNIVIDRLEGNIERKEVTIHDLDRRRADLQKELEAATSNISQLRTDIETERKNTEHSNRQLDELNSKLSSQRKDADNELSGIIKHNYMLSSALSDAKNQLQENSAKFEKLSSLFLQSKKHTPASGRLTGLNAEVLPLPPYLSESEKHLDEIRALINKNNHLVKHLPDTLD